MKLTSVKPDVDPMDEEVSVSLTRREAVRLVETLDALAWSSLPVAHESSVRAFSEALRTDTKVNAARSRHVVRNAGARVLGSNAF
jgi:hypothetical protein